MAEVSKDLRRRVARTLEWFIVDQMAKKIPPEDRFFLLYEALSERKGAHDPRVARAIKRHGRGGFCISEFTLVTVTRAQLATVLASPEFFAERIDRGSPLQWNEARCIVVHDSDDPPAIVIFGARAVRHDAEETDADS